MPFLPAVLSIFLAVAATSIPNVPAPPAGVYEPELTRLAVEHANTEMKPTLEQIDRNQKLSAREKADLKRSIQGLRIAFYTTPKSLEDVVTFYQLKFPGASFLSAERSLLNDATDVAAANGVTLPPETEKLWAGKTGVASRYIADRFEIDVEEYLIDPKKGTITKKTVVMITAVPD